MTSLLRRLDGICRLLTAFGGAVAASLYLFIMLLVTVNILSTNLFGLPLPVVEEISADMLAAAIFTAIALAQQRQEHVTVDFFTEGLPKWMRRAIQTVALAIGTAFFAFLTWRTASLAMTSWQTKETAMALIPFPVYPFKFAVLFGVAIATTEFARQLTWLLIRRGEIVEHAKQAPL